MTTKKQWACNKCTFINSSEDFICEMCGKHNLSSPSQSRITFKNAINPNGRKSKSPAVIDLSSPSSCYVITNDASMETARRKKRRRDQSPTKNKLDPKSQAPSVLETSSKSLFRKQKLLETSASNPTFHKVNRTMTKTKHTTHPLQPNHIDLKYNNTPTNPDVNTKIAYTNIKQKNQKGNKKQSSLFDNTVTKIKNTDLKKIKNNTDFNMKEKETIEETNIYESKYSPLHIVENKQATKTYQTTSEYTKSRIQTSKKNQITENTYEKWFNKSRELMKSIFRIQQLRNLQPIAIEHALRGRSQIVVMATGGGKSLCYQLPAATLPGITIVITPLIALMVDQVDNINKKGVPAAYLASSQGAKENMMIMKQLVTASSSSNSRSKITSYTKSNEKAVPYKLLYCTPELIETDRFRAVLTDLYKRKKLNLFAMDEAHCLSTWGHDFRPAYRKLSWLRQSFPSIPCIACTATATPKVIQDIRNCLGFGPDIPCHKGSFDRKNVRYEVRYKDVLDHKIPQGSIKDMLKLIKEQHDQATSSGKECSGIIYVHKRDDTNMLVRKINQSLVIKAAAYHAGLKDKERAQTQRDWTNGMIKVVVATVAFGMGIDKSNVRYVLHWNMPKTVEGFYQESGRAGRDGFASVSVVYYSKEDPQKYGFLIRKNAENKNGKKKDSKVNNMKAKQDLAALERMVEYCEKCICRRQNILQYFGETIVPKIACKNNCDYCINPSKIENAIQLSHVAKDAMKHVNDLKRYNRSMGRKNVNSERRNFADETEDEKEYKTDFGMMDSEGLLFDDERKGDNSIVARKGFVKASAIFSKYETIECKGSKRNGFVNFKPHNNCKKKTHRLSLSNKLNLRNREESEKFQKESKVSAIIVPEHLRSTLPDPLQHFSNSTTKNSSQAKEAKSNSEISDEIENLKKQLAKIQESKKSHDNKDKFTKDQCRKKMDITLTPPPKIVFRKHKRKIRK